jgi:hypothetical protein
MNAAGKIRIRNLKPQISQMAQITGERTKVLSINFIFCANVPLVTVSAVPLCLSHL